jgi:hypothetical protein
MIPPRALGLMSLLFYQRADVASNCVLDITTGNGDHPGTWKLRQYAEALYSIHAQSTRSGLRMPAGSRVRFSMVIMVLTRQTGSLGGQLFRAI